MACCFSCFKQHFASGQNFSYSLGNLGRFYCDYVELMAHFDEVLPGRVHRVLYEALVDDTERAVRTASAEQVRQPIFREGLHQWRHFEPWLDSFKQALGPVLDDYPIQG